MNSFNFNPIAIVHSPFKEKFAVPRQPDLVKSAKAKLEVLPPYDDINAFTGLHEYSHIWLVFSFHKNSDLEWRPMVRPPRLGGNKRIGVFATRSPNRPNNIGLSLVEFHGIEKQNGKLYLNLGSLDLVDGTPIIDIKPYIPYADARPDAQAGFATEPPNSPLSVQFSEQATAKLLTLTSNSPQLRELISEVLKQDPRPAYKKSKEDNKIYTMNLDNFDIRWQCQGDVAVVLSIEPI